MSERTSIASVVLALVCVLYVVISVIIKICCGRQGRNHEPAEGLNRNKSCSE